MLEMYYAIISSLFFIFLFILLLNKLFPHAKIFPERNGEKHFTVVLVIFYVLLIIITFSLLASKYKQGQIDALEGKIKYEKRIKITKPDTIWVKIK